MAFNIWKLHCKNVDLTIVIQPDIIIINILYISIHSNLPKMDV